MLINEERLNQRKREAYANSHREKDVRGALKGAVDHELDSSTYVIVDSLNYIKGFRYELYCCARTMRCPHCVIWVACDEALSVQWNEQRLEGGADGYDPLVMGELRRRFEAPIEGNRWDCPLFKVKGSSVPTTGEPCAAPTKPALPPAAAVVGKSSWRPKKPISSTSSSSTAAAAAAAVTPVPEQMAAERAGGLWFSGSSVEAVDDLDSFLPAEQVLERLWSFLTSAPAPVPNLSTLAPQHTSADLLYELDQISQRISHQLLAHQASQGAGVPAQLLDCQRAITLHRHASASELQRLRGQWVKLHARNPPSSAEDMGASFVDFLALHL